MAQTERIYDNRYNGNVFSPRRHKGPQRHYFLPTTPGGTIDTNSFLNNTLAISSKQEEEMIFDKMVVKVAENWKE